MTPAPGFDLDLVRRLEAHAVDAWPPTHLERADDGWIFRATPGLARGRSNHALPPTRVLSETEISDGAARARAFAERHDVGTGMQISPLELHGGLRSRLEAAGWSADYEVLVLTAPASAVMAGGEPLAVSEAEHVSREWLDAWAACEQRRNGVQAHADTVFRSLAGRARFVMAGDRAAGIGVEADGLLGLFCLAVAPGLRRAGLGSGLVRAIVAGSPSSLVYLQVEAENAPAVSLYERLGFQTVYRYCHCVAP